MQLAKEKYSKEDVYKDTTYVFTDYIKKYPRNFIQNSKRRSKCVSEILSCKSSYRKKFR